MEKIDQGIESSEILLAEIDTLARRLRETDPGAMTKLEELMRKLRVEARVEISVAGVSEQMRRNQ